MAGPPSAPGPIRVLDARLVDPDPEGPWHCLSIHGKDADGSWAAPIVGNRVSVPSDELLPQRPRLKCREHGQHVPNHRFLRVGGNWAVLELA